MLYSTHYLQTLAMQRQAEFAANAEHYRLGRQAKRAARLSAAGRTVTGSGSRRRGWRASLGRRSAVAC